MAVFFDVARAFLELRKAAGLRLIYANRYIYLSRSVACIYAGNPELFETPATTHTTSSTRPIALLYDPVVWTNYPSSVTRGNWVPNCYIRGFSLFCLSVLPILSAVYVE